MSGVATAIVASAVIGGVVASKNASKTADAASKASADSTNAEERLGYAQLDQSKLEFEAQQARAEKMDALTEKVTNSQIAAQDSATAQAQDYADYNKNTFRPLEQGLVADAENYATPEEQERVAGQAGASVEQQFANQRLATSQDMARMGVNPNSGRFAGTTATMAANEALGESSAENTGRQNVINLGWARRMDAASLGRGLPSAQATSAGLAINAGNSAVNNQATANNSYTMAQQPGIQLMSGASNTFGTAAANAAALFGASNKAASDTASGYGSAAGMLLKYYNSGGE